MPCVALIGSSGGGAATLGHTDAAELLRTIHQELHKVENKDTGYDDHATLNHTHLHNADRNNSVAVEVSTGITRALFVSLRGGKGFDLANPESDTAALYSIASSGCHEQIEVQVVATGLLREVNNTCEQMDKDLAKQIRAGHIHGLICISCSVDIHAETLRAAAEVNIPVTGSGGTSLSVAASKFGISLVGNAGGSVATTSYTRAVSYTHALATAWKKPYRPYSSKQNIVPSWTSVLNACLPAYWAVVLSCRCVSVLAPFLSSTNSAWLLDHVLPLLQTQALPTVSCVVMATARAPHHGSTAVMAAAVASVVCQKSVLGGLLAGFLVASSIDRVLFRCIVWNIPATMTNLVVAGGVGAVVAIVLAPLISYLQILTDFVRWCVHLPMSGTYPGIGFVIGILSCWGSKVGLYHTICLPVILIEMELGAPSLWGAIDEATLVLVSAGICSANLLFPSAHRTIETTALSWRGLRTNLLFGDFIEAAYPSMESSVLVNVGAYLASGVAVEMLSGNSTSVMSMAYVPLPISVLLAEDFRKITLSYFSAFGICFLFTAIHNLLSSRNPSSRSRPCTTTKVKP
ncbi:hypothetical protein MHU86_1725 [Fragilaria crotonensis]|nr:hypothetical protein MHU86_1725 [Fragilaria crotonensis]